MTSALTMLVYGLHIGGGALALVSGTVAVYGSARLLPGPYHVPPAFFLPQLLPLCVLVFWMVRIRYTGRFEDEAHPAPNPSRSTSAPTLS